MKICLGTTNLSENFDSKYWELFKFCLNNSIPIHSYRNYPNVKKYFDRAKIEKLQEPQIITKILLNRNPFKKILNIKKQIKFYKNFYSIEKIKHLQLCNNPHNNFFNQFLIKNLLLSEKNLFLAIKKECNN